MVENCCSTNGLMCIESSCVRALISIVHCSIIGKAIIKLKLFVDCVTIYVGIMLFFTPFLHLNDTDFNVEFAYLRWFWLNFSYFIIERLCCFRCDSGSSREYVKNITPTPFRIMNFYLEILHGKFMTGTLRVNSLLK